MIAAQTQSRIEAMFVSAAKTTLVRDTAHEIAIQLQQAPRKPENGRSLLVITISSFEFRLMTLFNISNSSALRSYYGFPALSATASKTAMSNICEEFAEIANMCCGAFNRSLSRHVSHLGMSTPYRLNGCCEEYISVLQPRTLSRFDIRINDSVDLDTTLCVCANRPFELKNEAKALDIEAETESGVLELF
jgi:hypothetical protein